jgi:hypothetical protein
MAKILTNAFSFNMAGNFPCRTEATELTLEKFTEELKNGGWESSIGHSDMANLLTEMTGVPITANRRNDSLGNGDVLLIAQYSGPRLQEGATALPEGAKIKFLKVGYFE